MLPELGKPLPEMNQPPFTDPHYSEHGVTALVLAGGNSSRMGTDKALLHWQGIPLLERVCQAAAQSCSRVYVLTPWPQRYQLLLPEGCHILLESISGQGPLVALEQGLRQISTTWLLLLACDLPLLNPTILQRWITLLPDEEVMAVVPHHLGRWEPLCGFYHAQSHPDLRSFLKQGGRSFQAWLSTLTTQKIALDATATAMLWNCNSPEDLTPPEV